MVLPCAQISKPIQNSLIIRQNLMLKLKLKI